MCHTGPLCSEDLLSSHGLDIPVKPPAGSHHADTLIPLIWPCGWRSDIIRLHCKRPSGTGCCFWGEANFDSKPFSVRPARRSATGITLEGLPQALSAFDSGGIFLRR